MTYDAQQDADRFARGFPGYIYRPSAADSAPRVQAQERRRQILDEATRIISTQGFWGFSVRQVAEACGLTEPSIIYHFKSKSGLLIAVLEQRDHADLMNLSEKLGVRFDDLWLDEVSFGLEELCSALIERNAQQPQMVQLYLVTQIESLNQRHPAHDYYQNRERRVMDMMTCAAKHDGYPNPEQEARFIFSQMDGLELRWLRDPDNVDLIGDWNTFMQSRRKPTTRENAR